MEPTLDLDLRDVFDGFEDISRAARNLTPVFQRLVPDMRRDQESHFAEQKGTDAAWPPRAASTMKRRGKSARGGLLGKLKSAFRVEFSRVEIAAFEIVEWSGVHQDGGRVGHGAVIPQREHMYMSTTFLNIADERIAKHVFGAWQRGAKR